MKFLSDGWLLSDGKNPPADDVLGDCGECRYVLDSSDRTSSYPVDPGNPS
jgi:hypothetical protein